MVRMEKFTTTDVKRYNKKRIFKLIHYVERISRQELADKLQLSLPTVNQNLKLLMEEDLIVYEGSFNSTGGRKPQVISVNADSEYAVSINIENSGVRIDLINLMGNIVGNSMCKCDFFKQEEFGKKLLECLKKLLAQYKIPKEKVLGVGITVPGILDNDNKYIVSIPTMNVKGIKVEDITSYIPYRCNVMNDARANAYAEYWYDKNPTGISKIYLMLNDGVGGSYIQGDVLKKGNNNRYGEFGHMTIHPNGKKCICGKKGCFEAYVSSKVLSDELCCTLDEFFENVKKEYFGEIPDNKYIKILDKYLEDLAIGINNLYTIFDGNVVLGGPVAEYLKQYENVIKGILVKRYSFDTDASYFSFSKCTQEHLNTGAALMFIGEFIDNI